MPLCFWPVPMPCALLCTSSGRRFRFVWARGASRAVGWPLVARLAGVCWMETCAGGTVPRRWSGARGGGRVALRGVVVARRLGFHLLECRSEPGKCPCGGAFKANAEAAQSLSSMSSSSLKNSTGMPRSVGSLLSIRMSVVLPAGTWCAAIPRSLALRWTARRYESKDPCRFREAMNSWSSVGVGNNTGGASIEAENGMVLASGCGCHRRAHELL